MNSCGVSKQDYENLKAERDKLLEELDLYKNGEQRLLALIDQNIKSGDITSARKNITLLNKYHPESMNKQETIKIVTAVEREEANIARIATEREAAEKAARIERQRGFNNPQAASARVIDVVEANFHKDSRQLRNGEYLIIRPSFFMNQNGVDIYIDSQRDGNGTWVTIVSNQLFRLQRGGRISVLVKADYRHGGCYYDLVELQQY